MPQFSTLALASSVFKEQGFDLQLTIDAAVENGFESVQLYVNDGIVDFEYREKLIQSINSSNLKNIVIHLPDRGKMTGDQVIGTQLFVDGIRDDIKLAGLIHFEDSIPIDFPAMTTDIGVRSRPLLSIDIPRIDGLPIGIENSKMKEFDVKHVMNALRMARANQTPFVFDIGRIMYPIRLLREHKKDTKASYINEDVKRQIIRFIEIVIRMLKPELDIIHTTGKTEFDDFKDFVCALGAQGDITAPLIEALKDFMNRGGIVVLEHEDLGQALESKKNLEL